MKSSGDESATKCSNGNENPLSLIGSLVASVGKRTRNKSPKTLTSHLSSVLLGASLLKRPDGVVTSRHKGTSHLLESVSPSGSGPESPLPLVQTGTWGPIDHFRQNLLEAGEGRSEKKFVGVGWNHRIRETMRARTEGPCHYQRQGRLNLTGRRDTGHSFAHPTTPSRPHPSTLGGCTVGQVPGRYTCPFRSGLNPPNFRHVL